MLPNDLKSGRLALILDAASCAIMGCGLLMFSGPVSQWTQIPGALLWWAGLVLLPIAAFMSLTARLAAPPPWMTGFIVLGNAGWAVLSVALSVLGVITPNLSGWVVLIGQAVFVAAFAVWEFTVLGRPVRHPA